MIAIRYCMDEIFKCGALAQDSAALFYHHKCNEAALALTYARATPKPPTAKGSPRAGRLGVFTPSGEAHA